MTEETFVTEMSCLQATLVRIAQAIEVCGKAQQPEEEAPRPELLSLDQRMCLVHAIIAANAARKSMFDTGPASDWVAAAVGYDDEILRLTEGLCR